MRIGSYATGTFAAVTSLGGAGTVEAFDALDRSDFETPVDMVRMIWWKFWNLEIQTKQLIAQIRIHRMMMTIQKTSDVCMKIQNALGVCRRSESLCQQGIIRVMKHRMRDRDQYTDS